MKIYTYRQFRAAGFTPASALRSARTCREFAPLETAGLVRFRVEDEQENYFDVYGEPDGYEGVNGRRVSAEQERKEICDSIERYGCLWLCAEFRASEDDEWQHADSIGMLVGYRDVTDPLQNCYAVDLAASAVEAFENLAVAPSL